MERCPSSNGRCNVGSDQLFHKRREAKDLKRRRAQRNPFPSILIVCEGEKTEPHYLEEIRDHLKLASTTFKIVDGDECGNTPDRIVGYALGKYKEKACKYDQIFCVFDKDRHTHFDTVLLQIRQTRKIKNRSIEAITSIPCFEVWVLLHFRYTTKQFVPGEARGSICNEVIQEVKKCPGLSNYSKSAGNLFAQLRNNLPTALDHAHRLEQDNKTTGSNNPSTQIHQLIRHLCHLRDDRMLCPSCEKKKCKRCQSCDQRKRCHSAQR